METSDTRLVALHAENGSPHARLSSALAALEGADWGLLLHGEAGLARQLAALLGAGTLRIDPRLRLRREVFAAYGLALATTDADWRGAKAVWLLEPTERDLKRANRSNVPIIIDGTLAPGGSWLTQGAQYLVYRDGATLSGFGDLELSAIFGTGKAPVRAAPAPSDLSLAMVLRDLATLPLRLARAARTTSLLAEQFAGAAQNVGPTALLLAPDSAADTLAPLGGVLAAAAAVPAGTLLTPGVQPAQVALGLLRQDVAEQARAVSNATASSAEGRNDAAERRDSDRRAQGYNDQRTQEQRGHDQRRQEGPRTDTQRPDNQRQDTQRTEQPRNEFQREISGRPPQDARGPRIPQGNGPQPSNNQPSDKQPNDRPNPPSDSSQQASRPPRPTLNYTPEIVFSESLNQHAPTEGSAELTQITPISSGPDEPDILPVAEHEKAQALQAATAQPIRLISVPSAPLAQEPTPSAPVTTPVIPEPEINLPPDLPPTEGGSNEIISGLNDEQQAHFARLRDWRNTEAKRLEISRFIVASNATLADIALRNPQTEEELRQVRGMGPERVRKYGAAILATLRREI